MNIGGVAERSGLTAKTIRYYEEIGLVIPDRLENGYRDYATSDLHILQFVQRARSLGFSVVECRSLLGLYGDDNRASADVKELATRKIADIDRKIEEMLSLRDTLANLAEACNGDHRPDCPILDDLAQTAPRL